MTKNILELQEELLDLRTKMDNIITAGESEARELNEVETNEMAEIRKQIDEIEGQINAMEEQNKINKNKKSKISRKMNLINMINSVIEGRQFTEDEVKAMAEARADFAKSGISPKGQIVYRTINATQPGQGEETVIEDKWNLEVAIRNNLIASKMGCDYVGGLIGTCSIPKYSGSNVKWAGETATAEDGQGEFSEVTLNPHRLTATLDVSKQWLLQSSYEAEAMLIRDLASAVAEKLDMTIFGTGEGDTNTPAGIFSGITAEKAISEINYKDVLKLEEEVEGQNAHNYMFICNPKVKFALKGTQMANGLQMVFEGNEIDGYRTISSNSVVDKGIVCLDPRELVVGQWGGVDIIVDPYTKAADGQVRLVVNAYFDAKLRGEAVAPMIFQ